MAKDREDRIKKRAHALWVEQGHPEGKDVDHWHQATREIDAEGGASTARSAKPKAAKPAKSAKPVKADKPGKAARATDKGAAKPASAPKSGAKNGAKPAPALKAAATGKADPAAASPERSPAEPKPRPA